MVFLLDNFTSQQSLLNLFSYITLRTFLAILVALAVVLIFGPSMISKLRNLQGKGQPIREDGPQSHLRTKVGTPTMGGLMMLMGLLASVLLWADLTNNFVRAALTVVLGFGLIGFVDDYLKVRFHNAKDGLTVRGRLFCEFLIAGIAVWLVTTTSDEAIRYVISVPIVTDWSFDIGFLYYVFAIFVVLGAANACNLTDGLDGLAIGPVILAATSLGFVVYAAGHAQIANYLGIFYIAGAGELAVVCGAVIGAGLGFLWFNAPPAQIFMGDTGSLALGGLIGLVAVAAKHEIVLALIGGLFVIEALSVIIQVLYFRLSGKRIFLMAPIHHHFEHKGWSESQIVMRFWIIASVLAILGLSTLKLR